MVGTFETDAELIKGLQSQLCWLGHTIQSSNMGEDHLDLWFIIFLVG